jgi:hypothetical protein
LSKTKKQKNSRRLLTDDVPSKFCELYLNQVEFLKWDAKDILNSVMNALMVLEMSEVIAIELVRSYLVGFWNTLLADLDEFDARTIA